MGLIGFLPPFLVSPHCSSQKKWNPHWRIPWSMFILLQYLCPCLGLSKNVQPIPKDYHNFPIFSHIKLPFVDG
jgi:hypothetical protein